MVKDRLKELKEIRRKSNLPINSEEVSIPLSDGPQGPLYQLLDKIGPLYTRMKELNIDVIELRKGLNDHGKREKFVDKISDVKTEARSLFKCIQEVSNSIDNESHLISHVARTHHLSLVTFFSCANTELSNLQIDLHDKHKKYVEKELQITGQEVSDEELENLLEHPAEIFNKNILQETQMAKQQLLDIQQRHDEVLKIEKSIVEVNQLFLELAMLVKEQGEKVNRIENYVFEARDKAELGKNELMHAQVNQTKARKKKFIIAGIVLVILVIIIIIIIVSVKP